MNANKLDWRLGIAFKPVMANNCIIKFSPPVSNTVRARVMVKIAGLPMNGLKSCMALVGVWRCISSLNELLLWLV